MTDQITAEETTEDQTDEIQPEAQPEQVDTAQGDAETFPREYVEDLRKENGKYRQRAQQADELATRLHSALVAATGRLADPSDLPFDEAHLSDPDTLTAAVDALVTAKPHLASRKPFGDIGQGARPASDGFNLAGLLRSTAG
ncbi:hypothetical protein IWX78_000333 [Mycetocola sp. CAN_C7]|uniref:hypothetical protein n=1 Tax=Mycetocola sp. CAN_C7 TaxID=2787724 RepID=UPI0018CA3B1E